MFIRLEFSGTKIMLRGPSVHQLSMERNKQTNKKRSLDEFHGGFFLHRNGFTFFFALPVYYLN